MGDAPIPGALAVETELRQSVEPAPNGYNGFVAERRVPKQSHAVELTLADEGLRVDDEPRLALRTQHVPAVQILVHEERHAPIHAAVDVEREVEQRAIDRSPAELEPARYVLCPPLGLVGQQPERLRPLQLPREPRKQLADDRDLIGADLRERRPRPAALAEIRAEGVVARDDTH